MSARHYTFQAIGTHWEITVTSSIDTVSWLETKERIDKRIQVFDAVYSRFKADSLVSEMAKAAGTYSLPDDGYKLLEFYKRLYDATNGKVTPLIGQTIADAGYDATYTFEQKKLQQPPSWDTVLSYDEQSVTLRQPALLDFGAAGKGYLIDIVGEILEKATISSYTINAGGDIRHSSDQHTELEIGLENPLDTSEAIGIARLNNQSLCASAGSRRKWGSFHHIIDPLELTSPEEILATWVIASGTMTADGLATALFFTDAVVLQKQFSFSYAVLFKDMSLHYAKDFPITTFERV